MTPPESAALHAADAPSEAELMRSALEFHASAQYGIARQFYSEILAQNPAHAAAWHHLGLVEHMTGRHAQAAEHIRTSLDLEPGQAKAQANLAAVLRVLKQPAAALEAAQTAIRLDPGFAPAHSNLGNVLEDAGSTEEALAAYLEACRLDPFFVEAHVNAADLLRKQGRREEALRICTAIARKRPDAALPHFHAGNIYRELLRFAEAKGAYARALALQPDLAPAHCNLGNILHHSGDLPGAVAAYERALALKPDMAEVHCNLGAAYEVMQRPEDAARAYRRALDLNPDLIGVRSQLFQLRRAAWDWADHDAEEAALLAAIAARQDAVPPFSLLSKEAGHKLQLDVARRWSAALHAKPSFAHPRSAAVPEKKLRIGYLSGDFHRHATALLMVELFERHDRTRFEVIGYSYGTDDRSEMRHRLGKAFDRFVEFAALDDRAAAQRIYDDGIDILVELKGYTQQARNEIAAHRPAPIQVNFIGYPGTMGAPFIDYIIADPIVLPLDQQPFYDEKIVHLPECYQPNDRERRIAERTPTRAECGLPEEGFVFCCFNNAYKLTPKFFAIWIRLLAAVPGSVLWLIDAGAQARANLRHVAEAQGIAPESLIFAPRMSFADHLARHRQADLFLDTLPYNAHTTTSDALWTGLPVVTILGDTFAGRVAASLLHAMGLPELVTRDLEEYEALALKLARTPDLLDDIRRKLHANRLTEPLFDTARFARHLESAYRQMWEIHADGRAPEVFAVPPLPRGGDAVPIPPAEIKRRLYTACPLCGSAKHEAFLGADCRQDPAYRPSLPAQVKWHLCRDCGHVFTEGYFDSAEVFAPVAAETLGHEMEAGRHAFAPLVAAVARHIDPAEGATLWFDARFGDGALLLTAAEWGFSVVGADPSRMNVADLSKLGFAAHLGGIENLPEYAYGHFSVVSFIDALPRLPDPAGALAAARRLLRPDGILVLSMPNKDATAFKLLHAKAANPYWGRIADCHMFGRARLYALLRREGFEPHEYRASTRLRVGMEVIARRAD